MCVTVLGLWRVRCILRILIWTLCLRLLLRDDRFVCVLVDREREREMEMVFERARLWMWMRGNESVLFVVRGGRVCRSLIAVRLVAE